MALNEDAADLEKPTDDIRSALAAAVATHDEPIEPAAKPEPKPKADKGGTNDAVSGLADAAGNKSAEDAEKSNAAEKPEAKEVADKEPEPKAKDAAKDAKDIDAALGKWSAADKATFKALPEPAQQLILRRHKEMEADHTRKTQAIASLKSEYEPVEQMFAPYRDTMKAKGFSPRTLIEAWANVEKQLAAGPDEAVKIVQGLVSGYKIPVDKIASALGLSAASNGKAATEPTADELARAQATTQLPPELLDRLTRVERFAMTEQQRRTDEAQSRLRESESRVMNQIDEFKSAADKEGNLLHPHFEEVEADMTALANAHIAMKQSVPPLDKLYESAVWANPSTRDKVRTAETQSAEKKRADEARAKAAAAKKASVSVTGAPGSGQAPSSRRTSELSLREQLLEAAEEASAG